MIFFIIIIIFYFSPREEADWVSHSAPGAEAARALQLPFFCLFVFDTRQYSSTSYKALSYSTHPHP